MEEGSQAKFKKPKISAKLLDEFLEVQWKKQHSNSEVGNKSQDPKNKLESKFYPPELQSGFFIKKNGEKLSLPQESRPEGLSFDCNEVNIYTCVGTFDFKNSPCIATDTMKFISNQEPYSQVCCQYLWTEPGKHQNGSYEFSFSKEKSEENRYFGPFKKEILNVGLIYDDTKYNDPSLCLPYYFLSEDGTNNAEEKNAMIVGKGKIYIYIGSLYFEETPNEFQSLEKVTREILPSLSEKKDNCIIMLLADFEKGLECHSFNI